MKTNNRFRNCASIDEARKLWRTLSMTYHPDKGGTKEDFQKLTEELNEFINDFNNKNLKSDNYKYVDPEQIISELLNNMPPELQVFINGITETSIYKVVTSGILGDAFKFFGKDNSKVRNVENFIKKLKK